MSQHKKQYKPTLSTPVAKHEDYKLLSNPFTITDPSELTSLLKAIYRDGATGTSRSLSKDVQTIMDLVEGKE